MNNNIYKKQPVNTQHTQVDTIQYNGRLKIRRFIN